MLALAFWNINDKQLTQELLTLATELGGNAANANDVIICLVEIAGIDDGALVQALNRQLPGKRWWSKRPEHGTGFLCLSNSDEMKFDSSATIAGGWPVKLIRGNGPTRTWYRLWFVHLAAPLGSTDTVAHQMGEAAPLHNEIKAREHKDLGDNTVVIGDFNMPPFAAAMVSPRGLNAVPCKTDAAKSTRTVAGVKYSFFYNPVWRFLGDRTASNQPGTFQMKPRDNSIRWYMIDQVVLRPSLMNTIINDSLRVITKLGQTELISAGGNMNKKISDHLPITLSLDI
ncbi:hypothetical protein ACQKIK_18410 [Pseudomonas sp. NPDC047961]